MNAKETREKIMNSDEFVLSEVKKLQTLYALKNEIRYDHERVHEPHTESVAEHIYAIHCLIDYFLPLVNPEGNWDKLKVHKMAQYHDIDEIETGDIVGYKKTTQDYNNEKIASEKVISQLPETLQTELQSLTEEFDKQSSIESKLVKAIDKFESVVHMYSEVGKVFLHKIKYTRELHADYKGDFISEFPIMARFEEVMADAYEKEGLYHKDS